MEEVGYCGAGYIYGLYFNHSKDIVAKSRKQIIIDILSSLANYTSQTMCWVRYDQQYMLKILKLIGFEMMLETKNANSDNVMYFMCFDWFDEDCVDTIKDYLKGNYSNDGSRKTKV